jgi:hypothetical protein
MGERAVTRRALLVGASAAALLGMRQLRLDRAASDDPSIVGWGTDWVMPHWRHFHSTGDSRVLRLPAGLAGTAPDQPIPAFLQDHDLTTGEVNVVFEVTRDSLRPGVLLGGITPFDFRAITVEGDRLVVAEYNREGRELLATADVRGLVSGRRFRLGVSIGSDETRATLCTVDDEEQCGELVVLQPPRRGAPGVIAVHPPDLEPAEMSLSSFDVKSDDGFSKTPPVCVVAMTGTPVQDEDGDRARVQVWSAWPASVVFERRVSDASDWEEINRVVADSQPYVARTLIAMDGEQVIQWRARLRSLTSRQESTTAIHELGPPSRTTPLVLLAASCAHLVGPPPNEGFERLQSAAPAAPRLLVFQGDLGYPNNSRDAAYLATPDFFADRFQRLLARPDFSELRRKTAIGITLDDHDYGPRNNAHRGSVEPWAVDLWNKIHVNPSNDGFFEIRLGDVHCLALDVRRYADSVRAPVNPEKTRLGAEQLAWMESRLRESDGRLFVVFCGGTFARRTTATDVGIGHDTFVYGWPDEYRRTMSLFNEIQETGRRVLLVSGDSHSMRVHHHPDPISEMEPTNLPVVEFICAGLRASLWDGAPENDPTLDVSRHVLGRSGGGMIVVDPPTRRPRQITLRAIGAGDDDPVDLFPPLVMPFEPATLSATPP